MTAAAIVISILLQIVFPIVLGFLLIRRYHSTWKLWLFSGLAFLVFDMLRNTVLGVLSGTEFYVNNLRPVFIFSVIVLSLVSGLLQQLLRWGVFRFLRNDTEEKSGALVSGAGFGGVELIILYGAEVLITFIFAINVSSSGGQGLEVPPERITELLAQVEAYWARPFYLPLLEALPSLSELATQLALALMTWVAVRRGGWLWHGAAVLWYTMIASVGNTAVVWYRSALPSTGGGDSLQGALALLSFVLIAGASLAALYLVWVKVAPLVESAETPGRPPKPKPAVPVIDAPATGPIDPPKANKLSNKPGKPVKLSKD